MVKKGNKWNLAELQDGLVKDTEQRIEQGFEEIKNGESSLLSTKQDDDPKPNVPQVYRTARMFHKERTQDVLIHCPESLHRRLRERKDRVWDEYGERLTINNMVIEAIAMWLDQQEGKAKVNTTI